MTEPSIERVLGRVLRDVAYYQVPGVTWEVSGPIHVVDYGIELDFDGVYLSLGWEDGTHQLHVSNSSMEIDFPSAEGHSIGSRPWDDMIGTRLVSARFGSGHGPCGPQERWVAQLEFEGDARVWIAAANYFEGGNFLIPCSDEMVVVWSAEVARSYELLILQN